MERRKTIGPRNTTGELLIIKLHCLPHNFEILARDGIVGIDAQSLFKMEYVKTSRSTMTAVYHGPRTRTTYAGEWKRWPRFRAARKNGCC